LLRTHSQCSDVHSLDKIVFIVPFSWSRLNNLKYFLLNIHKYLQTNKYPFNYQIIVAEILDTNRLFNKGESFFNFLIPKNFKILFILLKKGRLINGAVDYALKNINDITCLVIHDVDIIPSSESKNLGSHGDYRCRQMPYHMTTNIFLKSKNEKRVYNKFLTGGVLSLTPEHFKVANGFSNQYFGWGGEDDDWTLRMFNKNLCIMRPNEYINGYEPMNDQITMPPFIMMPHDVSKVNKKRFSVLSESLQRQFTDGLFNILNLIEINKVTFHQTFTHLLIDTGS
jgi:hypothetical protein